MNEHLSDGLLAMYGSSDDDYLILVFTKTGRRIRLQFDKNLTGGE